MPNLPLPKAHPPRLVALAAASSVLFGSGIAVQTRINGQLAAELEDGYVAALISFGVGLVVLCIGMLLMPSGRRGLAAIRSSIAARTLPWWVLLGGAAGAFIVLAQGLSAAVVGVALFTVALVAGQTLSGLLMDLWGIGGNRPRPVTPSRLVGSALALVAVTLVVSAQFEGGVPYWLLILPLAAGFGAAWQQAVNGQARVVSRSPLTASFLNFIVGSALLAIAVLVRSVWVGWPADLPDNPWLYTGGLLGVVFIAGAAIVAPITGVLILGLGATAGQLIASLLLDLFAPVAEHPLTWTTVLGIALTLIAVLIAALPARRATTAK